MNESLKEILKFVIPAQIINFIRKYNSDKQLASWPKHQIQNDHVEGAKLIANRHELLKLMPNNGIVAELGVDKGLFSQQIVEICNPRKLHLIDIWASARFNETKAMNVKETFKEKIENDSILIHRQLSTEVVNDFEDNYFDWIYIDTSHTYKTTLEELNSYSQKIKPGGLIAGHDYTMGNWLLGTKYGVIEAVTEFCVTKGWKFVYLTADYTENCSFVITRIK